MKETRKIFLVKGWQASIEKALIAISGFKAINIAKTADESTINCTFSKNKSLVCTSISCKVTQTPISIWVTPNNEVAENVINPRYNIVRQFMEIALKHNVDIGDHISNCNSDSIEDCIHTTTDDCVFCNLLDPTKPPPKHEQKPLYESESFAVRPGSGAFLDGYLMILPRKHVMSYAELDSNQFLEMQSVIDDIKFILENIYGNEVLIWENGSGQGGKGKAKSSIVHAHIHAAPVSEKFDISEKTKLTGVYLNSINISDLKSFKTDPYLLTLDARNNWHIIADSELYIPRQYIRQILALEIGVQGDVWDWRQYPFWDNVSKTANSFLQFIRGNFNNLPPRIQERTRRFAFA